MADNERLTVDQKVKVVLFYAETKSVVATQRRFHAHFGTRCAPCKQTIYRLSLEQFSSLWGLILYQMSNAFVKIKMCYVYNQWYDISCVTLYITYIRILQAQSDWTVTTRNWVAVRPQGNSTFLLFIQHFIAYRLHFSVTFQHRSQNSAHISAN